MRNKALWLAGAAIALGWQQAPPARAQTAGDSTAYRREIFQYARAGRPDPFRSLLRDGEMGIRIEDLELHGIVYDPTPGRSLAVFAQQGSSKLLRVHEGGRIGGLRVLDIRPGSVDLLIDELGVTRRATLELKRKRTTDGTGEKGGVK
jgi:hypothetical protein